MIRLSFKSINDLNKVFTIVLRELMFEIVESGLNTLNDFKDDNRNELSSYKELHPIINYPFLSKQWEQLSFQGLVIQPVITIIISKILYKSLKYDFYHYYYLKYYLIKYQTHSTYF